MTTTMQSINAPKCSSDHSGDLMPLARISGRPRSTPTASLHHSHISGPVGRQYHPGSGLY